MLNSIRENIERRLGIASRPAPVKNAAPVENLAEFSGRYKNWRNNDNLDNAQSCADFFSGRVYKRHGIL
jgi:hypothetical protein